MSSVADGASGEHDPYVLVADLHRRYARRIQRFCRHQLGSHEEAEDATQLTFINALRGLERGSSLEYESTWLFTIAANVCLNMKGSSTLPEHAEERASVEREPFLLDGLAESLQALPEPQRQALLLREWQGLSYREIATKLQLSQAAVETLLLRARRSVAAALSDRPRPTTDGGDAPTPGESATRE